MKTVNLPTSREKYSLLNYEDELIVSSIFNADEARRFINYLQTFKEANGFDEIFIRIPGTWNSDTKSRQILFDYLKETNDYVIIESSPILRAYFKTELTLNCCDPNRILRERI